MASLTSDAYINNESNERGHTEDTGGKIGPEYSRVELSKVLLGNCGSRLSTFEQSSVSQSEVQLDIYSIS
jgi:hypothetical protein